MAPSCISKIRARPCIHKPRRRPRQRFVECLPPEMITEIVTRVAATSPIDLFRCKQTCKILHEIADEKTVLQQAAIEGLYSHEWRNRDKVQSFFERCRDSNNPKALYRLGMEQYFSQLMGPEGLKNLEKAAAQGYNEAIYALALISMCTGDNERMSKGADSLFGLMREIKGGGIVECRQQLRDLMMTLQWLRPSDTNNSAGVSFVMVQPKITCTIGELHKIESNWEKEDYENDKVEDNVVCRDCKCCREVNWFLRSFSKAVSLAL